MSGLFNLYMNVSLRKYFSSCDGVNIDKIDNVPAVIYPNDLIKFAEFETQIHIIMLNVIDCIWEENKFPDKCSKMNN